MLSWQTCMKYKCGPKFQGYVACTANGHAMSVCKCVKHIYVCKSLKRQLKRFVKSKNVLLDFAKCMCVIFIPPTYSLDF